MQRVGVLPSQWIEKAVDSGWVVGAARANVQPASLDLRLGDVAHRLRCSFLPGDEPVEQRLAEFSMGTVDLRGGGILERNRPYLVPLRESLRLPPELSARANPKSSTGRVDVFARMVTDNSSRFDDVRPGYEGGLWLEVVPRSFTVRVAPDLALNQLRFAFDRPRFGDAAIRAEHAAGALAYRGGEPVPDAELDVADGLFLGVDLSGRGESGVGYKARRNSQLLDLTALRSLDPDWFWEPIHPEPGGRLVLEPEEFYLLISAERARVPPHLAAEMIAYDPTAGELRTHYAGFFDPGFGHDTGGPPGTRAVLEVRARDVPFVLEHGQAVCKLGYEPMLEVPQVLYGADLSSNYQRQEVTLSKHFRPVGPQAGSD